MVDYLKSIILFYPFYVLSNMMNVFIDTSVLYNDPYWKKNFYSQLLKAAIDCRVNLFISEVVVKELKYHYLKQIDDLIKNVSNFNINLRNLSNDYEEYKIPNKEILLDQFEEFYSTIFNNSCIMLLKVDASIFETVLYRAINHIKPFKEKKSEFKDAVIWLSYANYSINNDFSECYLITNNKSDFVNSDGQLHDDLKQDCERFIVYTSIEEFYKSKGGLIDKPLEDFKLWISNQNINEQYVYDLLFKNQDYEILREINDHFERMDPSHFVNEEESYAVWGGYADVCGLDWYECSNIDIEIISDYALISGELFINAELDLHGYNAVRDPGEDKFPFYGSVEKGVKIDFNFLLYEDKLPFQFEVTDIREI